MILSGLILPIPLKALVVSQCVKACKASKDVQYCGVNCSANSVTLINFCDYPFQCQKGL